MAVKTNYKGKYYRTTLNIGVNEDGSPKHKAFYGKTKTEAENKKEEFIRRGAAQKSYSMSAEMFIWLDVVLKSSGIKGSSYERYRGIHNNYIKTSPFASWRVKNIKGTDVQEYYAALAKDGKSYSQIQNMHKLLKRFFDYCVLHDQIIKNPCLNVVIPNQVKQKYQKEKVEIEVFSSTERDKILNLALNKNLMYGAALYFMFNFGMRAGEALGLTLEDIDQEEISIKNTLTKFKDFDQGKYVKQIDDPKTETSIRNLYFGKETEFLIRRLRTERLRLIEMLGNEYNNKGNLLLTSAYGTPIDIANLRKFWAKVLTELKIPYRKMHTSRHTFVTELSEKEVPLDLVQKMVGHRKGSKITEEVYMHARKDAIKIAMQKITK